MTMNQAGALRHDPDRPRTIVDYVYELADVPPERSLHQALTSVAARVGVARFSVWRWVQQQDCGRHARAFVDALDTKRAARGEPLTTAQDWLILTGGPRR